MPILIANISVALVSATVDNNSHNNEDLECRLDEGHDFWDISNLQ
jgi:hypothetical protein